MASWKARKTQHVFLVAAFAAAAKKWEQHVDVTSTSQGSGYVHGSRVVSRHTWYTTSQATKAQNRRLEKRKTLHLAFHHLVHDPVNLPKQKTSESQNFKRSENNWCCLYWLSYIILILGYILSHWVTFACLSFSFTPVYLLILSALPCPPLENQRLPAHRVAGMESSEFSESWLFLLLITLSNESKQDFFYTNW